LQHACNRTRRAEVRVELDGNRDADGILDAANDVDVAAFNSGSIERDIGWNEIDVQFVSRLARSV
jgi:hypothetical protein